MIADANRRGILRRQFLAAGAGAAAALLAPAGAQADEPAPLLRRIPASGEAIPAIGMGTWITFNVGEDAVLRAARAQVLQTFFAMGGRVIDSSPMYGSSEAVLGWGLQQQGAPDGLFAATKVWTPFTRHGRGQMQESQRLWGVARFDLMQVHNLLNWEGHLPGLLEDRAAGSVRYVGITTSHGRRHEEFAQLMASQPLDVVQFSYNILDREAEQRLLPLASERGMAVLVNRPFRTGALFERLDRHPLPPWAAEIGCSTWAQFLLKFIVSHAAVTCVIPATSRVDHMRENMRALYGPLPDAAMRARMIRYVEAL